MDNRYEWLREGVGMTPELQSNLLASLLIILVPWIIRSVILRIALRRTDDLRSRYWWRKTSLYVIVLIGVLLVGRVWYEGFGQFATFLGLLSAGLAIALRDLIVAMAGWIFIIWRRPFEVGDRIQIGEVAGDVIDLRIFQFTILEIGNWVDADQSTGRIIHVPNGKVFTEPQANYTRDFLYIWNEIQVLISLESNWQKAKQLLLQVANRHTEATAQAAEQSVRQAAKKFMIFYSKLTPTVYTSVKDSGIQLSIRYLCPPRQRRGTAEAIWEDVLNEFANCSDIDFAYPTQRFYNNLLEGKPGTKPSAGEVLGRP